MGAVGARVGLDVGARYDEVRRLICACPAYRRAVADGWDADDLLQDALMRLVSRQLGRSAWDPSRRSLGGYVWMVARSTIANYIRDHSRAREVTGAEGPEAGVGPEVSLGHLVHASGLGAEEVAVLRGVMDGSVPTEGEPARLVRERLEEAGLALSGRVMHGPRRTL